jgi:hypothetical protein
MDARKYSNRQDALTGGPQSIMPHSWQTYPSLEVAMRMLVEVIIPHEPVNSLVRKGMVGKILTEVLEATKPETVYFTGQHGKRRAVLVVDVPDPSKIPVLAEPWFPAFNAELKFKIAMTPDDLKKSGLDALGKKWAQGKAVSPAVLTCQEYSTDSSN